MPVTNGPDSNIVSIYGKYSSISVEFPGIPLFDKNSIDPPKEIIEHNRKKLII